MQPPGRLIEFYENFAGVLLKNSFANETIHVNETISSPVASEDSLIEVKSVEIIEETVVEVETTVDTNVVIDTVLPVSCVYCNFKTKQNIFIYYYLRLIKAGELENSLITVEPVENEMVLVEIDDENDNLTVTIITFH